MDLYFILFICTAAILAFVICGWIFWAIKIRLWELCPPKSHENSTISTNNYSLNHGSTFVDGYPTQSDLATTTQNYV